MSILKRFLLSLLLLAALSCTSEQHYNQSNSAPPATPQTSQQSPNNSAPPAKKETSFDEADNQMSVAELQAALAEVKAIEREARTMASMRRNWAANVSECMRVMGRLKPRAQAISSQYKRMLSAAGSEIAGAAMNLTACISCLENDNDDCHDARDFISKAERDLRREARQR